MGEDQDQSPKAGWDKAATWQELYLGGIMARTLAGHTLWKAKPSTYCNQVSYKCLPLSKALLNKY